MESAKQLQTSGDRVWYNGGLDFWKLIFTLVIVFHHTDEIGGWDHFYPLGASAVGVFFLLSRYFLAGSPPQKQGEGPGGLGGGDARVFLAQNPAFFPL